MKIHLHLGSFREIRDYLHSFLISLKSHHTSHEGEPHDLLGEEARELREVQKPAVSGTAITLGMDLSFGNSLKLFGAKTSKLGNSSSVAKLGMFNINLHKTNHLVWFTGWS